MSRTDAHAAVLVVLALSLTACQPTARPLAAGQATVTVEPSSTPVVTTAPLPAVSSDPATQVSEPSSTGAEALPPIAPRLVLNGPRTERVVALTFDLCERDNDHASFQKDIVDYLVNEKLPATFFMGGKWAQSHPEDARLLAAIPLFEIGNHSWSHVHFTKTSTELDRQQVLRAQDEIAALTGTTPRYFRFPYGESDARTVKVVGDAGLVAVGWDDDTGDPDRNQTPSVILSDVKRHLKPGSIILMHANGRGVHTREALPLIVGYLRAHGYGIVTVPELLGSEQ